MKKREQRMVECLGKYDKVTRTILITPMKKQRTDGGKYCSARTSPQKCKRRLYVIFNVEILVYEEEILRGVGQTYGIFYPARL